MHLELHINVKLNAYVHEQFSYRLNIWSKK